MGTSPFVVSTCTMVTDVGTWANEESATRAISPIVVGSVVAIVASFLGLVPRLVVVAM
jgi:hypothetical protein